MPNEDEIVTTLRLPQTMRDAVNVQADRHRRSFNAQVLVMLENELTLSAASLPRKPKKAQTP